MTISIVSMLTQLAVASSAFAVSNSFAEASNYSYDGTTSDLARQFYELSGEFNFEPLPFSDEDLPDAVIARLAEFNSSLSYLSPHLQRALLWDSGLVVERETSNLVQIQVKCTNASMDSIAVSTDAFLAACDYDKTCQAKSKKMMRSAQCNATKLANFIHCAVNASSVNTTSSSSIWATGGTRASNPQPNVARHQLKNGPSSYLMFAIHTLDADEVAYGSCPSSDATNGMIIPCVPLPVNSSGVWCTPKPNKFVTDWLVSEVRSNATRSSMAVAVATEGDETSRRSHHVAKSRSTSNYSAHAHPTTFSKKSSGLKLLHVIPVVVASIVLALVGLLMFWRYTKKDRKRLENDVYRSLN